MSRDRTIDLPTWNGAIPSAPASHRIHHRALQARWVAGFSASLLPPVGNQRINRLTLPRRSHMELVKIISPANPHRNVAGASALLHGSPVSISTHNFVLRPTRSIKEHQVEPLFPTRIIDG